MQHMQSTACTKTCFKCGAEKPLTDFYKHPRMADGHLNKCKDCTKKDVTDNRGDNLQYYREYDRSRIVKHREKELGSYIRNNPDKRKAHNAVSNALRDGRLFRADNCEHCGCDGKLVGHHHSYLKEFRLDVTWLCSPCHAKEHKRLSDLGEDPDK